MVLSFLLFSFALFFVYCPPNFDGVQHFASIDTGEIILYSNDVKNNAIFFKVLTFRSK